MTFGRKALGECDRCGLTYKLNTLKAQVVDEARTKIMVCTECFDVDHIQIKPEPPEFIGLRNARSDAAERPAVRALSSNGFEIGVGPSPAFFMFSQEAFRRPWYQGVFSEELAGPE